VKNAKNVKNKKGKPVYVCVLKVMSAKDVNGTTPGRIGNELKSVDKMKSVVLHEMKSVDEMIGNELKIGNVFPGAKVSPQALEITRLLQRPGENNAYSLLHGVTFKSINVGKTLRIQGRGVTCATMKKGGPELKNMMQQPIRQDQGRDNCKYTWKADGRGHHPLWVRGGPHYPTNDLNRNMMLIARKPHSGGTISNKTMFVLKQTANARTGGAEMAGTAGTRDGTLPGTLEIMPMNNGSMSPDKQ